LARSKSASARAAKANAIRQFSLRLAALRSDFRWASHAVDDYRVAIIASRLSEVDQLSFELAQDIASGQFELDLPDEPRPLFERPKRGEVVVSGESGPIKAPNLPVNPFDREPVCSGCGTDAESILDLYALDGKDLCEACYGQTESGRLVFDDPEPATKPQEPDRVEATDSRQASPRPAGRRRARTDEAGPAGGEAHAPGHDDPGPQAAPDVQDPDRARRLDLDEGRGDGARDAGNPGAAALVTCNRCGFAKPSGDPSRCPKGHTAGFTSDPTEDCDVPETAQSGAILAQSKAARKPPTRPFKVLYRHDPDLDPIVLGELRAKDFDEARTMAPKAYAHESVRLPDGDTVKIDFDKLEVVRVPATARKPRKSKEAVHADA
jgi:hypothetical protein